MTCHIFYPLIATFNVINIQEINSVISSPASLIFSLKVREKKGKSNPKKGRKKPPNKAVVLETPFKNVE